MTHDDVKQPDVPVSLARQLREEFDRSFSEPRRTQTAERVRLAVVRLAEDRFAVRLDELQGIETLGRLVALPGNAPYRLGIAGVRGKIVPIYDLAQLLDISVPGRKQRIALLCGERDTVGLACQELLEHLLVPAAAVRALKHNDPARRMLDAVAETAKGETPVLSLSRIVGRIESSISGDSIRKER